MSAMDIAIGKIVEERARQDAKWGDQNDGRPDGLMLAILVEEVGEVAKAMLEHTDDKELKKELVQVAAVCVKWLEFKEKCLGGTA